MSEIYELNIPFRASRDYQRLVLLLYALGLAAVWSCAYPFGVSVCLSLALVAHGVYLLYVGRPYKRYVLLSFWGRHWVLTHGLGLREEFAHLSVVYDFGFIFCVALQTPYDRQYLLFFRDQLTEAERRFFYLSQLEWRKAPLPKSISEFSE